MGSRRGQPTWRIAAEMTGRHEDRKSLSPRSRARSKRQAVPLTSCAALWRLSVLRRSGELLLLGFGPAQPIGARRNARNVEDFMVFRHGLQVLGEQAQRFLGLLTD